MAGLRLFTSKFSWLASIALAGFVFLLPVENALAISNFSYTNSFTSADTTNVRTTYMDVAGTWNGATDLGDTATAATGDRVTFTFRNTGPDPAYDVGLQINVPVGFRLPAAMLGANFLIQRTTAGIAGCNTINSNNVQINQPGGAGTPITFSGSGVSNLDMPVGCGYSITVPLITNTSVVTGANNIDLQLGYNQTNTDSTTRLFPPVNTRTVTVNPGSVTLTKTTSTTSARNGDIITYTLNVTSAGGGGIFDVVVTDVPPAASDLVILDVTNSGAINGTETPLNSNVWVFPYIGAGQVVTLTVTAQVVVDPIGPPCPNLVNDASATDNRTGGIGSDTYTVTHDITTTLQLTHNMATSYCELCGTGIVYLLVNNIGDLSLDNVVVRENLMSSGLTYDATYPGGSTFSIDGGAPVSVGPTSVVGSVIDWDIGRMDSLLVLGPSQPQNILIAIPVTRNNPTVSDEGLRTAVRNIQATATYNLMCNGAPLNTATPVQELPIHQPLPQVVKQGRNVNAGQLAYVDNRFGPADTVFGHVQDNVIWRVRINNTGLAGLQDALITDTIGGNFDINWVCSTEASATNAINSVTGDPTPAGCVPAGDPVDQSVPDFAIDDPFGTPNNDRVPNVYDVDAPAGGFGDMFYVGRILGGCQNRTNTADIQWGCEENRQPPFADGGFTQPALVNGALPGYDRDDTAQMYAQVYTPGLPGLVILQDLTGFNPTLANGVNATQPVGSKGRIVITIENRTGATIRNVNFTDVLPPEYVLDTSFTPVLVTDPAYGNDYDGMINRITLTNENTVDLTQNTQPHYTLDTDPASARFSVDPTKNNVLRHGDRLIITLGIILIDSDADIIPDANTHFDLVARLDQAPEDYDAGTPANSTDPNNIFNITNRITADFEDICSPITPRQVINDYTEQANVEDLDVNITDSLYILTNDPNYPLPLTVTVTNNGGHDADDYSIFVSFGEAMTVLDTGANPLPAGCSLTTTYPPTRIHPTLPAYTGQIYPLWDEPVFIPSSASVYRCYRNAIAPGNTETFTFWVTKNPALIIDPNDPNIDDDLTFRADVVGEIRQTNGVPWVFPPPKNVPRTSSPEVQLANNYTLDGIRSRVLGFNLTKTLQGNCTENNPPPLSPDTLVQIGEDCGYHIESGGWFGFQTPGFSLIRVENIVTTDDLPNGQGFIPYTFGIDNFIYTNTSNIVLNGPDGGASTTPLSENDIAWNFNNAGSGITVRDEWLRVDLKTRVLNDGVDMPPTAPNIHAATSYNLARASFDALFESVIDGVTYNFNFCVSDTTGVPLATCDTPPGYPVAAVRDETLTIQEPNLIIQKDVCNESLNGFKNDDSGVGPITECGNYQDIVTDGDTNDSYVYRIAITNADPVGAPSGLARAPAYDVILHDVLDLSDLIYIIPFGSDGIDNDGDGEVDEADEAAISITPDNTPLVGVPTPPTITFDYTHAVNHDYSSGSAPSLKRIDSGQTVYLYYRVDPDIRVAPLQILTNTVDTSYDSLADEYGAQNAPRIRNDNTSPDNLTGISSLDSGRARIYTATGETARVQMLPLVAQPKQVIAVSHTAGSSNGVAPNPPRAVVVGEEVRYQLTTSIPVANLENFYIQDTLPLGVRCIGDTYPELDLENDPRYSPAGFFPLSSAEPVTVTCVRATPGSNTPDVITWNFTGASGYRALTSGAPGTRFDLVLEFDAQIENSVAYTQIGNVLVNGGAATGGTDAFARYDYPTGVTNQLDFDSASIIVTEPDVTVTKTFSVTTPATVDAGDIVTVTVTATNSNVVNTANAYNLRILDDLVGTNMSYHGNVSGTDPPDSDGGITLPGPGTGAPGTNQPLFSWTSLVLAPNASISFTFEVQVDDAVQALEILTNTIQASWTSLPDRNRLLSGTTVDIDGLLDADGAPMGMRNGALPNTTTLPNDYEVQATDQMATPAVSFTKQDVTLAPTNAGDDRTIGAHRDFTLTINLPEGTTHNVSVVDQLDAGSSGISYVVENNADYNITYEFPGVRSINGTDLSTLGGSPTPEDYEGLFTAALPVNNTTDTINIGSVNWNIGTVVTDSEDDLTVNNIAPQIIVHYKARIHNDFTPDPDTSVGDVLNNAATLTYDNVAPLTPATVTLPTMSAGDIVVTEPALSFVSKTCVNISIVGNPDCTTVAGAPDAGDVLRYVVTLHNGGNATAYDVNIADTATTNVTFDIASASVNIGGNAVGTFVSAPATPVALPNTQVWNWGHGNGDDSLDVPAGQDLVLNYEVTVNNSVEPNETITNFVVADWTSLDNSVVQEATLQRNGSMTADYSGCTTPAAGDPNDYCVAQVTPTTVTVVDDNTIIKTKLDDSYVGGTVNQNIRVGDTVEYVLNLTLQEGTTRNVRITDILPTGMRFVAGDVIQINGVSESGGVFNQVSPFSYTAFDQTNPAQLVVTGNETTGTTIEFVLGDILNEGVADLNNAGNNVFTIRYRVQLVNDVLTQYPNQAASTNRQNNVYLRYEDVTNNIIDPTTLPRLQSSYTMVAQQPVILLADISKTHRAGGISGDGVGSGTLMPFRLSACNTNGLAPAYDLVLDDVLPPELDELLITAPVVTINGVSATAGVEYSYSYSNSAVSAVTSPPDPQPLPAAQARTMRFVFNDEATPLNPGQCIVIDYDINVRSPVGGINLSWDNLFQVTEYHSLDWDNANHQEREDYGPVGPVAYNMNNIVPIVNLEKALISPAGPTPEATIGDIVSYQVVVPGLSADMLVDLFDVRVTDTLPANLEFVDASVDTLNSNNQFNGTLSSSVSGNQVTIGLVPAGAITDPSLPYNAGLSHTERAVITVNLRVKNDAVNNVTNTATPTSPFGNAASYSFASQYNGGRISGGPLVTTNVADDISVVEPDLSLVSKQCYNLTRTNDCNLVTNLPGDVLRYTLTMNVAGSGAGDIYSNAYDISIHDSLSSGLAYRNNTSVSSTGLIDNPLPSGNGVTVAQQLLWDLEHGTNIDIAEGVTGVTVTYDVDVLPTASAGQTLSNSAYIQWTSQNDSLPFVLNTNERTGADGAGGLNDYRTVTLTTSVTTPDTTAFSKTRLRDTYDDTNDDIRIGDFVDYELRLSLQEGTTRSVVLDDVLPQGLQFEGIVSINNDSDGSFGPASPFDHATYTQAGNVTVTGDARTSAGTTVHWILGDITNTPANDGNNDFIIVYRVRVLENVFAQGAGAAQVLTNNVTFNYVTPPAVSHTLLASAPVNLLQPNLSVNKSSVQIGFDANAEIQANEVIEYTIDVQNTGTSPAYDVEVHDLVPSVLRNGPATITMVRIELDNGGVITPLPSIDPVYDDATGLATWNLNSGQTYAIPGNNQILRIVYRITASAGISAGLTNIINQAWAQTYYSYDGDVAGVPAPVASWLDPVTTAPQIYTATAVANSTPTLNTQIPYALQKLSPQEQTPPGVNQVTIGQPFTYTILVPSVPMNTSLYDVRVTDSLNFVDIGADLAFLSVTRDPAYGSITYTPVNTGTVTNPVIEDVTNGIDIPANEQIALNVTVLLRDTSSNRDSNMFANIADYTFNQTNNTGPAVAGAPGTTAPMEVVEPFLTMDKRGLIAPNNQVRYNDPIPYTLVVENTGRGPAYDITVADTLPSAPDNAPLTGGTCNTWTTGPVNTGFTARVFENDEVTQVGSDLVQGTDFVVSYTAAPTCQLVVTTLTPAAHLESTQKLFVYYNTYLDQDSLNGAILTNRASVTEYFSQDTPAGAKVGEIRRYTNSLTSTADEDTHFVVVEAPVLRMQKTVINETTGLDPGVLARPGDTLRYVITITNTSAVPVSNLRVTDEPDALNLPGYFVPGSMNVTTVPPGAVNNSLINSGANGAGLLDISNLSLPNNGDSVTIEFTVQLVTPIISGTFVYNQASVIVPGFSPWFTDDPNVNGMDDPVIVGDEDPTQTIIGSTPLFQLQKTSQDVSGDPNILVVGDVLRYTITAKNIGVENAINTILKDNIPANTTYVANSTTLNGIALTDVATNVSPLQDGMLINAPEDSVPGNMRASVTATTNIATVTFDVTINANVVNGAIISNQAFVTGDGQGSGVFAEQLSDDPGTEIVGDPTRDVVGNMPVLDVQKSVDFVPGVTGDVNGDGVVDPGDAIRYTFKVSNTGAVDATNVKLMDAVPANTTYIANTSYLNGLAVNQPDGGVLPLTSGFNEISSTNLTPPLPATDSGVITVGQSATFRFDVRVNVGTPVGTLISNQGTLTSNELPDELTDEDGIDENGDQPTVVMVGADQEVSITKEVFVVGGGVANLGGELEYVIRIRSIGSQAATDVVITDDISSITSKVSLVPGSLQLNGSPIGTSVAGNVLTADFGNTYGTLEAGNVAVMRFRVKLSNNIADFAVDDSINNIAYVSWNAAAENASDDAVIDLYGVPHLAGLSGDAWHDSNFNFANDSAERKLANWTVNIYFNGSYLDSVYTDANGHYYIYGLIPNAGDLRTYDLKFVAPGAGANTASLGFASTPYANDGPQQVTEFNVSASSHTAGVNLPITPNGVVYDAVFRTGVTDVRLEMINSAGVALPVSCFDDPAQQNQITLADGYYKFDLNFTQSSCAPGDAYTINVYPLSNNYVDNDNNINTPIYSRIIPPARSLIDPAFDVPACPGTTDDRITLAPNYHCEVGPSEFPASTSIPPRAPDTTYYVKNIYQVGYGDNQIFNNHIPVDPDMSGILAVTKTSPLVNVVRSQMVPYTITLRNPLSAPIYDVNLIDTYPAGFKYVAESARIFVNGTPVTQDGLTNLSLEPIAPTALQTIEPQRAGLQLLWPDMVLDANDVITFKMLLIVGAGVGEGEYINRVQAFNSLTSGAASGEANATVRVVPDPTFDCSDIIGKVFNDKNLNGYADEGEAGIAGVRVTTAQGLQATTDEYGRYHFTCAVVPNQDRGSNFIVKLDERSLPTGYRVTSENPRTQRATRGKMLKYNFGAAIHHVVRLDMMDAVFKPDSTEIRVQWLSRLDMLMSELAKDRAVLRLSYLAENEDKSLVNDRLDAVKAIIEKRWADLNCCYRLMIETEVFWRKGGPVDKGALE